MIRWEQLPPGVRKAAWRLAFIVLLLLAVAFLLGFTAGRLYERTG